MLINQHGVFRGMLSGGCLEGDLAVRAAVVIETGKAQIVDYNLAADDALWGLGVGCDGSMRAQLQRLRPEDAYAPFAAIADVLRGRQGAEFTLPIEDGSGDTLAIRVEPPTDLLVLGAGLDAEPVIRIASELGWRCTVFDHRPAYVESGDFGAAENLLCHPAEELTECVDLDAFDAAIIMSHHLVSDGSYLEQLAATNVRYIGLLGPEARRKRLLADLGDAARNLEGRVHGPAGLELGGRGPGPIALAIVAQIQQVLAVN